MKEYKFKNGTVYVYGEVSKERIKRATIQLVQNARKCKLHKREVKQ